MAEYRIVEDWSGRFWVGKVIPGKRVCLIEPEWRMIDKIKNIDVISLEDIDSDISIVDQYGSPVERP